MKILYLAVNPDGTEVCSNYNLFRYKDALDKLIKRYDKYTMYADRKNHWCNTYSEGYYTVPKFNGVELPKGTIKMITGRDLTWEDKPFKIDVETGYSVVIAKDIQ